MVSTLEPKVGALYNRYLKSDRIKYATPETRYRYLRVVNSFLMYTLGNLSKDKLLKFIHEQDKHSSSYQRWVYQVLKGLYDSLRKKWPLHPKELPYGEEPERPYLETDEAQQLMELARSDPMDYAMFRLVLVTGIRKRELRDLNLSSYDPPRIRIETKKHGERRVRTLDEETADAINAYVTGPRTYWDGKHKGRDAPLFLSPTGNRMPDSTLTIRFAKYMRALGKAKGCGMHSLRRTCVTWEAEGGMNEMELMKLHGWKSPKMPAIYARLKPAVLEAESYGANPLIKEGE